MSDAKSCTEDPAKPVESPARSGRPPPLACPHEGWAGLPMRLDPLLSRGTLTDLHSADPELALACSGQGRRWYTYGRRTRELYTAPRMFELYGAGEHLDRGRWEGKAGEVVVIQFPSSSVNRLLHGSGQSLNFPTRHELFDDRLADLVLALWGEAAQGSPRGPLYSQGLMIALIGLLTAQHGASPAAPVRRIAKFSPDERARLRGFIADELAGNLCIERMAAVAGMSSPHFSRVFKATFEQSPHAYVLERRIEAACRALRLEPDRAIADIAAGAGFSSQAHFTETFRRKVGATPAQWRRGT